jgi:hypothetical protein
MMIGLAEMIKVYFCGDSLPLDAVSSKVGGDLLLLAIQEWIRENLHLTGLDASMLCARFHISRSRLYALFGLRWLCFYCARGMWRPPPYVSSPMVLDSVALPYFRVHSGPDGAVLQGMSGVGAGMVVRSGMIQSLRMGLVVADAAPSPAAP